MFEVGQQVVCVDNKPRDWRPFGDPLHVGGVYTVAGITLGGEGVLLHEAVAGSPTGYWANRFRPVRKTSIEVFEQMLAPPPKVRTLEPQS
jgi:hypothetical protein